MNMTQRQQLFLGLALAALMAATRGQHFALASHLPDASLAVFFLAGVYLRPAWAFPALFALSAGIDLAAVTWGGVSAFCITPAYGFLLPAYAALWAAGRWYAGRHRESWSTLIPLAGAALVGATLSELLSTGGFYLFSGAFADPSLAGIGMGLVKYMPTSLGSLALYLGLAALAHAAFTQGRTDRPGVGMVRR
jgi:hypothetical protein